MMSQSIGIKVFLLVSLVFTQGYSFIIQNPTTSKVISANTITVQPKTIKVTSLAQSNDNENETNNNTTTMDKIQNMMNPLTELFSNFDDIVDDFFYKRMGNGEVFYGKRKYKPSGKVEGNYNGFGLSDKLKIDMTREYRDEMLELRREKKEEEEKRRRN